MNELSASSRATGRCPINWGAEGGGFLDLGVDDGGGVDILDEVALSGGGVAEVDADMGGAESVMVGDIECDDDDSSPASSATPSGSEDGVEHLCSVRRSSFLAIVIGRAVCCLLPDIGHEIAVFPRGAPVGVSVKDTLNGGIRLEAMLSASKKRGKGKSKVDSIQGGGVMVVPNDGSANSLGLNRAIKEIPRARNYWKVMDMIQVQGRANDRWSRS